MPRPLCLLAILMAIGLALAASGPSAGSGVLVVQTDMTGREQVPPVETTAYGFVRFFFDETRRSAEYTVDVKGLSGTLVLGADIHRGDAGANGPVVKHLADGGFIVTSGRLRLTPSELEEMLAGRWYVNLRTLENPQGELRGQIVLPPDFLPAANNGVSPPMAVVEPTPALPSLPAAAAPAPVAEQPQFDIRIQPPNAGDAGLAR